MYNTCCNREDYQKSDLNVSYTDTQVMEVLPYKAKQAWQYDMGRVLKRDEYSVQAQSNLQRTLNVRSSSDGRQKG